jgi:hypothetical protein
MASTQSFVATWASVGDDALAALERAVRAAGLEPIVGVHIGGLDRVTDDIEAGIRRSRLLIADFTGNRTGVYWEAGFARGLGLPVIFTCHATSAGEVVEHDPVVGGASKVGTKAWRDLIHFDVEQFPHIFWKDPKDLEDRVLKRIQANGWDVPRREDRTPT